MCLPVVGIPVGAELVIHDADLQRRWTGLSGVIDCRGAVTAVSGLAAISDQIGIIECDADRNSGMGHSHLADAPLN